MFDLRVFRRVGISLAMFALVALGSTSIARADPITFTLDNPNDGISAFPAPFATVNVDLTSATTVRITVTGLTHDGYTYLIGNGGSIGLNINGSGPYTFSIVSFTQPQTSPGAPAFSLNSGNLDGWGSFNFRLNNFDGYDHAVDSLVFDVTCAACNWLTDSDVLTPNASGYSVAAHIFVTTDGGTNNTGSSGYATTEGAVPEPTSMLLLGTGLIGIGSVIRKRLRSRKEEN